LAMARFCSADLRRPKHVLEALRLSLRDNRAYLWCLFAGLAKFHLGNEEEAVAWVRRSVEINRSFQAHISFWPPHWRGSGGSAKRDPKCRKDLQSFQSSRSPISRRSQTIS
jgi:hypothetical protein